MDDLTKETILKANRNQWSSSAKIEAEGLDWLYNDPTAELTHEQKLESYLLGESIPGARGELQKSDLERSSLGSLQTDETSSRVYEQTLNKFREDPLFIIKKLEMQQKQVLDKYSNIASNFERRRKEHSRHSDRRHRDHDRDYRDDHSDRGHRKSSRDHRSDRHSRRSEERHRSSDRRDRRHRDPSPYDESDRKKRKSRSRSPEPAKRIKGPERPKKYNPLKYAFGVNDDICPPDAIIAAAKRKEEARAREQQAQAAAQGTDESATLHEMQQQGSSRLREKLDAIAKDEREERSETHEAPSSADYIASVKRKAYESANMAEMIRRKASKQQDPFDENI